MKIEPAGRCIPLGCKELSIGSAVKDSNSLVW